MADGSTTAVSTLASQSLFFSRTLHAAVGSLTSEPYMSSQIVPDVKSSLSSWEKYPTPELQAEGQGSVAPGDTPAPSCHPFPTHYLSCSHRPNRTVPKAVHW